MLCKDIVAADCDDHARYTDALCQQHTIFILMQKICIRNAVIYTFAVGQDLCCLSPISQTNHIWC